ncbi:hypothetical protein METBIDRAFT_43121 [Metschnikowia bicuspidata var. bicuspidata NRRL YB-4993]|uniref:Autophagy-related protein 33 n=1 Tax=Metschnikowia bicuspidata var. bicuspidata NRRL YB-4993 TaxID=869754 RepID=A0A1A0HA35_9ASCO|nr:hypothetical protein METBIDRAFT_43121 [Metschnikowia bicuspidata var. bicuspidata NRRL YB-4993]OBA20737.1 hypothetical protein METBIDRAFT_43121 [Metschnikowia bicuspidata var. bicuspidata NRRL YB-4993]
MGRCTTVITLTGATSLGLLTGSLAYQSMKKIPELIRQLNQQASLKAASAEPVLAAIRTNFTVSNAVNVVLASLSTWLFSTIYKHSSAAGKHPYLLYSAVAAPLALATLYYQTGAKTCVLTGPFSDVARFRECLCAKIANLTSGCRVLLGQKKEYTTPEPATEDVPMDQSYIHVSDDSVSTDSSPETPIETLDSVPSAIESEVEDALSKKERVKDLENVAAAYNVASMIAGVGFAICSVGVIGDQFFL